MTVVISLFAQVRVPLWAFDASITKSVGMKLSAIKVRATQKLLQMSACVVIYCSLVHVLQEQIDEALRRTRVKCLLAVNWIDALLCQVQRILFGLFRRCQKCDSSQLRFRLNRNVFYALLRQKMR